MQTKLCIFLITILVKYYGIINFLPIDKLSEDKLLAFLILSTVVLFALAISQRVSPDTFFM